MAPKKPVPEISNVKAFERLTAKGIQRAWRGLRTKHQRLSIKGYSDEIGINNQTLKSILDGNRAQSAKLDALEEYIGYTFGLDERVPDESPEQSDPSKGGAEHLNSVFLAPRRNTLYFTGREELLADVAQLLATRQPVALSGLAGIGKTHLATEYAHRYRDRYTDVCWIDAATPEDLDASIAGLAFDLNCTDANKDLTERRLKKRFREQQGWLLVIDNADDLQLVQEWLALLDYGTILLTTRDQETRPLAACVHVDKMTQEESSLFLLRRSGVLTQGESLEDATDEDRQCTEEINIFLDGFPLALDQAGAYILETPTTLKEYLELYQREYDRLDKNRLLEERGRNALDHKESVTITYSLILNILRGRNPLVVDVLNLSAFLAPVDVPIEIFQSHTMFYYMKNFMGTVIESYTFPNIVNEAGRFSLLTRNLEKDSFNLHRLVQEVIRDSLDEENKKDLIKQLFLTVCKPLIRIDWQYVTRMAPHFFTLARWRRNFNINHDLISYYLGCIAGAADQLGFHNEAEGIYLELLTLTNMAPSFDDGPFRIERQDALGKRKLEEVMPVELLLEPIVTMYRRRELFNASKMLMALSFEVQRKMKGESSFDVLVALQILADIYCEEGQYRKYEALYLRIVEELEPITKEKIVDCLNTCDQLKSRNYFNFWLEVSRFHLRQRQMDKAILILSTLEKPVEKNQDVEALLTDPSVQCQNVELLTSYWNLMSLYFRCKGSRTASEEYIKYGATILAKAYGPKSPPVISQLELLGEVCVSNGSRLKALGVYYDTLKIAKAVYPGDHPKIQKLEDAIHNVQRLMDQATSRPIREAALASLTWQPGDIAPPPSTPNVEELLYTQADREISDEDFGIDAIQIIEQDLFRDNSIVLSILFVHLVDYYMLKRKDISLPSEQIIQAFGQIITKAG